MVKLITSEEELLKRSKINLGCGNDIRKDWINVDIAPLDGVDIVLDMEREKIPLPNNSVDHVLTSHVLEHVDNLKFVLNEISRILKKGGKFHIIVPAHSSFGAFQDPTHVRFFTELTFKYISGEVFNYYYGDLKLKVIDVKKERTDYYNKIFKIMYPLIVIIGKRRFDTYVDALLMNTVSSYYAILEKE